MYQAYRSSPRRSVQKSWKREYDDHGRQLYLQHLSPSTFVHRMVSLLTFMETFIVTSKKQFVPWEEMLRPQKNSWHLLWTKQNYLHFITYLKHGDHDSFFPANKLTSLVLSFKIYFKSLNAKTIISWLLAWPKRLLKWVDIHFLGIPPKKPDFYFLKLCVPWEAFYPHWPSHKSMFTVQTIIHLHPLWKTLQVSMNAPIPLGSFLGSALVLCTMRWAGRITAIAVCVVPFYV